MGSPLQFFDPFYGIPSLELASQTTDGLASWKPSALRSSDPTGSASQAEYGAEQAPEGDVVELSAYTEKAGSPSLHLLIGSTEPLFYAEALGGRESIPFTVSAAGKPCTVNKGVETPYWLSIDSQNGILRFGKHYTNASMVFIELRLKALNSKGVPGWIDKRYAWLTDLTKVELLADEKELRTIIHPLPVIVDRSPYVLSADKISLEHLASGAFTAPANLPEACQTLYGNVAGTTISLNDDGFPQFSDAIQRSCIMPGLWAYEKLKVKAKLPGSKNTYLRITLGYNFGESPGVPYVLEFWPAGHFSPVHDHGDACAVIKVLHGEINCTWYSYLSNPIVINKPINRLRKGDITWIGDNNYQFHKLHNTSKAISCTIQCYGYSKDDKKHYEHFRFLGDDMKVQDPAFTPNSDMSFIEIRAKMKQEWDESDM